MGGALKSNKRNDFEFVDSRRLRNIDLRGAPLATDQYLAAHHHNHA